MQVAGTYARLPEKVVQIFSHSFCQRHDQSLMASGCMFADFGKQIIDLPRDWTNFHRRVKQTCRTNKLFNHHSP